MKNENSWQPSKFERTSDGRWRSTREEKSVTSRLVGDLSAAAYANAIKVHAKGRLADLGCGKVPLFGMYRDIVTDVVCVDWSDGLHGRTHVDTFADLNLPLDLGGESFDTVIASDVIEHLHTPQALFDTAAAALRKGGKLIVGVPFLYWIHEAPHDYHRYTRFALERMSRKAGLEPVVLASLAGAPEVLADTAAKALASSGWAAQLAYLFSKALLSFPPIRKLSAVTRESMPLGYLLVAEKVVGINRT